MTAKKLEELNKLHTRLKFYADLKIDLGSDYHVRIKTHTNEWVPNNDIELMKDFRSFVDERFKFYNEQFDALVVSRVDTIESEQRKVDYKPACPKGYTDCANDPAYVAYYHPDWYTELYGDYTIGEAIQCRCCKEMCLYDNEQI